MISFESGACSRLWVGFSVKFGARTHRRYLRSEAWNHVRTNRCRTVSPQWNRSQQSGQDTRHRSHSGKVNFSIRIILGGCLDSRAAISNWQNGDVEARKIRADELV